MRVQGCWVAVPLPSTPPLNIPHRHQTHCRGNLCYRLGLGPPPVELPQLTSASLAAALQALTEGESSYAASAAALGAQVRGEAGLQGAIDHVLQTAGAAAGPVKGCS